MSRGQVAKLVRESKERHPERYCLAKNCLWALRSGPCPKHDKSEADFRKAFTPNKYGEYQ